MGTTASGIWFPDGSSSADPKIWARTMATSIENGLGVRMGKQEAKASLRATTPAPFLQKATTPSAAYRRVPLSVTDYSDRAPNPNQNRGNNATNISLAGDVATIQTSGKYHLSCTANVYWSGADAAWDFFGNINGKNFGLPWTGMTSSTGWRSGTVQDTQYLVAGDTVDVWIGVGGNHVGQFMVQDVLLTIQLDYAT